MQKIVDKVIDGVMLAYWTVAYVNYVSLSASVWAVGWPFFVCQKVRNNVK